MTALLSLMSCGRMQCVISSAAYPLTTERERLCEKGRGQGQKVAATTNFGHLVPKFHHEFLPQTHRSPANCQKGRNFKEIAPFRPFFFFFLNLDSIFFSTHQRKCHLPAHHEVSRVEKEFPERKFSLFVYGSFTKRADHSRRQITKSPRGFLMCLHPRGWSEPAPGASPGLAGGFQP